MSVEPSGRPDRSSRRTFVATSIVALASGVGGYSAATLRRSADEEHGRTGTSAEADPDGRGTPVDATGTRQAGVDRPATPPRHLTLAVFSADGDWSTARIAELLAGLGREIAALTSTDPDPRLPDGPGNLTVQVGIGADWVASVDPSLAQRVRLSEFAGSAAIPSPRRRGDLVVSLAADDPGLPDHVLELLLAALAGLELAWTQRAFRSPGTGTVARNPMGYLDGIVQPGTGTNQQEGVWIPHGNAAHGSVGVVRCFDLDLASFHGLSVDDRDAIVGRRADGTPLSGGPADGDVDLAAKTPDGEYLIPNGAHVRAAHPSFTGSALMARRGYGYRREQPGSPPQAGLLFLSYQADVATFNRTQQRMDRVDELMGYATPVAEVSFLVLPGFDAERPLGSTLFSA